MTLSPEDRATFMALMPHLGPDGDVDELLTFVRDHWSQALGELGAIPGFDQVRAGMIRVLPQVMAPEQASEELSGASDAIAAYGAAVADADPALLLARHPAWVGIAAMEIAMLTGIPTPQALSRAVGAAVAGFRAVTGSTPGRGDVLWAMAEQAEEAGWTGRARTLLEAAIDSPFRDPHDAIQTRLVLGLRLAEDGDPTSTAVLAEVADDGAADPRARTHALWVLAAIQERAGNVEAAREALEGALNQVDHEDEPETVQRIEAAIDALGLAAE